MKIRNKNHERIKVIESDTWSSERIFVAADDLGYSLHKTTMKSGTTTYMHYKNHFEVVYCIGGSGEIEDVANGSRYIVEPGVCYVLDRHDQHRLTAFTDLVVLCVFTPPVVGNETHDESGSYAI